MFSLSEDEYQSFHNRIWFDETNQDDFLNDFMKEVNKRSWTMSTPLIPESPKFIKIKQLLINSAEDAIMVKVKIWWQVYRYPQEPHPIYKDTKPEIYAFSTIEGVVVDAPDWSWKGKKIDYIKHNFKKSEYCQVYKILEHELFS